MLPPTPSLQFCSVHGNTPRDPENCVTGQKKSFVQDIVAPVTSADDIIGACGSSCPHQTLEQSDVGRAVTPLALDGYFCFPVTGWQLFP